MNLLILLLAFQAHASEGCEAVDLRSLIGPPMHQGDSGYCFAHSSAELIQAKLGFRVSPMQLAMGYILANPEELSGAASPEVKVRLSPEMFDAWKRDRLLEPQNYSPEQILTEKGLLDIGGEEGPTTLIANFLGLCPVSRLPTGKNAYKKYLKEIQAFHAARLARGISEEAPIGEVVEPSARAQAWSFRRWIEEKCGTPVVPSRPLVPSGVTMARNLREFRQLQRETLVTSLRVSQSNVIDAVDFQLDRHNPVAIGYAFSDLQSFVPIAGRPKKTPAEVDHAAVFAGRKLIKGRCHYFLRNSFGTDLSDYHQKFKDRVESGGVWVRPEEIPSLYSAVWLE